jgi:predicted metalloprotease with PDZ domain
LDTVLGKLYEKSFKNGKGYTEEMYQGVLEEISGISFKTYFEELIHGKGSWEMHLKKSFEKLGIELLVSENEDLTLKCVVAKVNNMNDSQRRLFEFWRKSS